MADRTRLHRSLHRQQWTTRVMHGWRMVHMGLALVTVLIVCYHVGVAAGPGLLHRLHLLH